MPSQVQLVQLFEQLHMEGQQLEVKLGNSWVRQYQKNLYLGNELKDVTDWQCTISLRQI